MNLYQYLLGDVRREDVAIIAGGEEVTYDSLIGLTENLAGTLWYAGVRKGERVAIVADNSPFWVASYLGILKIGAVAVPFPARLNVDGFARLVGVTGCATFCFDRKYLAKYGAALPPESKVVARDAAVAEAVPAACRAVPIKASTAPTVPVDERNDLAALMFTSGSTGEPNAVKVSHHNIMANTSSIVEALGLERSDRIMVVLPFDYCFGTSLLHTHLRVGATLVLHNAFQYVEDVLNQLERYACTEIAGVPLIYQQLLRKSSMSRRSWPHLRLAQQAGGKLADVFIREFCAAMPKTQLYVMYGQTEGTARLSYMPPDRLADKLGSIGRGMPGVRLTVVDPNGEPVAPGEVGEIVADGDNVTAGYLVPDLNKQNFRDGRLYTGDLAQVDEDGFIFIVGRAGDFVKPMGHRISCREIEDVLAGMPEVVEVAVKGVPDPDYGEAVKAYLVTTTGEEIPLTKIREHCRGRLADYAVPRQLAFLPQLPRNGSQKPVKSLLPA
jgi:acyl-CoA synthetase (AMP-forming)/AMP-acid ligase II